MPSDNSAKWAAETLKSLNATFERERVKAIIMPNSGGMWAMAIIQSRDEYGR
jgi:hypothetical protein